MPPSAISRAMRSVLKGVAHMPFLRRWDKRACGIQKKGQNIESAVIKGNTNTNVESHR